MGFTWNRVYCSFNILSEGCCDICNIVCGLYMVYGVCTWSVVCMVCIPVYVVFKLV